MAINDLSPAFIKFIYVQDSVTHTATFPVKYTVPPVPGVAPTLMTHDGSSVAMGAAMGTYVALAKTLLASTTVILAAEFWEKDGVGADPVWIWTHPINVAGTSAGASVLAGQLVHTYRTDLGGLYRNYLMETAVAANQNWVATTIPSDQSALVNFVLGDSSWIFARDNGKPIAFLYARSKTNDALRKRRWL